MKRMKRVLVVALVGMLAILPLTGCSGKDSSSSGLSTANSNNDSIVKYETLPAGQAFTANFGETFNYMDNIDYTINKFYDLNYESNGNHFYAIEITLKNNTDNEIKLNALEEISVISNGQDYEMVTADPAATLCALKSIPDATIYASDKVAAGASYTAIICCSVKGKSEKFELVITPSVNDGKRNTITIEMPMSKAIILDSNDTEPAGAE